MNILLTGFTGYVGNIIRTHLQRKHTLFCVSSRCSQDKRQLRCDLSDRKAVFELAANIQPEIVIHAAGNKNIDFCEQNSAAAFRINCDAIKNVTEVFSTAKIIYLSTDYVFDGARGRYGEDDQPRPLTVYGKSKLCGEIEGEKVGKNRFIVLRLSALFDHNASFVRFLNEKLSTGQSVECFYDSLYSPTYYKDFLGILDKLLVEPVLGNQVYHSCGQITSRYDFAVALAKVFQFDVSHIRKYSHRDSKLFLFNDLSLRNEKTRQLLGLRATSLIDALQEMRRDNLL